jgi:hypothetical protein
MLFKFSGAKIGNRRWLVIKSLNQHEVELLILCCDVIIATKVYFLINMFVKDKASLSLSTSLSGRQTSTSLLSTTVQ